MDPVQEIKNRLPIDELVRQYCQIQKKGRNFVSLCPFHNDTHPSFLISPDKGIAYCFACQKGGDIFNFYQLIEGVDFPQAIKELAEKVGIVIEENKQEMHRKDEKERLRECLDMARMFYRDQLKQSQITASYLQVRGVTPEEIELFAMGLAPDSFNATYDHLLKAGFSKKEITTAGLGIQKDMTDERIYDRFRNRLMFPIHDVQGRIVGFGGRTLGKDDAKYMNSPESPLYHKSSVLFGLHLAKEAMRERKQVIVVEGYFDVLACHRAGFANTVAACGTALTEDHAKFLKRYVETVVLCLDQDSAGRSAAERAFHVCSKEGLQIYGIVLSAKDPADVAVASLDELKTILGSGGKPYFDIVLEEVRASDLSSPKIRHEALTRVLSLLQSVPTVVERNHWMKEAAKAFGATETAMEEDFRNLERKDAPRTPRAQSKSPSPDLFSSTEIALGLFLLYPNCLPLIKNLIPPEEGFPVNLYNALQQQLITSPQSLVADQLDLSDSDRQRTNILVLYCEQQGLAQWGEGIAPKEVMQNCLNANKEYFRRKQNDITRRLVEARKLGKTEEETVLRAEYQDLLHKLSPQSHL